MVYFCILPSVRADRCTWLFDVCELPVLLRGALSLSVWSDEPVGLLQYK